jgi:hypothetical protein
MARTFLEHGGELADFAPKAATLREVHQRRRQSRDRWIRGRVGKGDHQTGPKRVCEPVEYGDGRVAAAVFQIRHIGHRHPGLRGHRGDRPAEGRAATPQPPAKFDVIHRTILTE